MELGHDVVDLGGQVACVYRHWKQPLGERVTIQTQGMLFQPGDRAPGSRSGGQRPKETKLKARWAGVWGGSEVNE